MGNLHNIKNTSKRSGTEYISKNRSLYNVVFTVLNYHSSSDQVHPRNNLFKTSRRIYQVERLSQTIICKYNVLNVFLWKIDLKKLDTASI